MEHFVGANFGDDKSTSYYTEKYTSEKSSTNVQANLQSHKLDDDEFIPGESLSSTPDNTFVRISEDDIKNSLEQANEEPKRERDEKEIKMCTQADDNYDLQFPAALRVDSWNNPVDVSEMSDFVRKNGQVLYQENGVVFTYLIRRAVHSSGLYYKVCSVNPNSARHTADRNISNDGRILSGYNLYYIIENKSATHSIAFNRYPCVEISMIGEGSHDMCDEWLCAGTERFGNSAKLSIDSSPHIMHPNASLCEYDGAWYPADQPVPKLAEWVIGTFTSYPFNGK